MGGGQKTDCLGALQEIVPEGLISEFSISPLGGSVHKTIEAIPLEHQLVKVKISFELAEAVSQDDWSLELKPGFCPENHWSAHLTPQEGFVADQHVFRSPALVVWDSRRWLALVPELDLIRTDLAARWYLDLDAQKNALILGLSDTGISGHVLYEKRPGAAYPAGVLEVGFYLFYSCDGDEVKNPWRRILAFLWDQWGRRLYREGQPLHGRLDSYVRHTYDWAFNRWGDRVWQQFELDGKQVGAPVFIVNYTQSPNYPGEINEREERSIWNQAWFSSLRSASGLLRYALRTGDEKLAEKARMTKELALSFPQRNGFFPSVIATEMKTVYVGGKPYSRSKGWDTYYFGNSNRNPVTRDLKKSPMHILDMSWTALLMLRWYNELEKDGRLLEYALSYASGLLKLQDKRGFFPAWIDENMNPVGILEDSPETSLSVTFLLELFEITGQERFKEAALKAMHAVLEHVVPQGRWEDFETYWSCSGWGNSEYVGKRIPRNNMYKQCNFSMYWTAEALFAVYKATKDGCWLESGRRVLDEMLMTQASWQPPYIHVNALGGFGVLNCDAEWNDARESLFAELIVLYGLELKLPEYVERGLSALRAAFVMMYCPENPASKEQWEKAWPFFGPEDYGFNMENYGHNGRTDSHGLGIGEFTIYDWGNGAASEAYLRMLDHLGEDLVIEGKG